jgi:hypothetical protein
LIDRGRFGSVFRAQDAFDEPLNGANVHLGFRLRGYVGQALKAEDVGESLDAHDLGRPEFRFGLLPERVAVEHETNAPEALGGKQAIEHRYRELGLAGAGCHGQQHLAAIGFEGLFDFFDGALLVGAQLEAEVERRCFQSGLRRVPIDIKLSILRGWASRSRAGVDWWLCARPETRCRSRFRSV